MSDVRKALEAAYDAIGGDDDNDREIARAAALAFLWAMPGDTMMFMKDLAAAIEKETP